MSIKEILSSDSNLSVTIKSTDLKEFADHIIKQTIKEVLASNMKSDEEYLTVNETQRCFVLIVVLYGVGTKRDTYVLLR